MFMSNQDGVYGAGQGVRDFATELPKSDWKCMNEIE